MNSDPIIYSYTRKQALADGFQVDVSETAREAGMLRTVLFHELLQRSSDPRAAAQSELLSAWEVASRLPRFKSGASPTRGLSRPRFEGCRLHCAASSRWNP
jgi:hypothetical protein